MRRKRNMRKAKSTNKLVKVLAASLVLSPALYMLPFENAYVQAVASVSYKAPLVSKPLPDYRTVVGTPLTLDLNQYFDGINSYSATVSNTLNLSHLGFGTTINQNMLTFTNDRIGTATVTVTGTTANGGTVADTFDILVVPDSLDKDNNGNIDISEIVTYIGSRPFTKEMLNETLNFIAPQKMTTPNTAPKSKETTVTIYKNSPLTVSPSELFDDDDLLTIDTFSLSQVGYVTASLSNNQLTLNALQHGSLSLDMSVSDRRGGKASNRYDVVVGNRSPVFTGQNATVTQNAYAQVDLKNLFSDPDGDTLQFGQVQVVQTGAHIQVEQTNDNLKIYGAAVGQATVTATANDSYGGTATGSFNMTVSAATYGGNHAPTVVSSIPNKTVNLVGGAFSISNVSSYFTDADGDSLSYAPSSSMAGIVSLSLNSGNLMVVPVAAGTATVTLTATDTHGASTNITFNVTVVANINHAPTAVASISDKSTSITGGAVVIPSVSSYFTDADGDSLSYSAISDTNGIVTLSLDSGNLTVTPIAKGSAIITLKAADPSGASAQLSFNIEVANSAPVAIGTIENLSTDMAVTETLIPLTFAPGPYFSDPDGDSKSYTVTSSTASVAAVSIISSGQYLRVAPVSRGTSTITLTAKDSDNAVASLSFDVEVRNSAPQYATGLGNRTYDPTGVSSDYPATIVDLFGKFTDKNNDPLSYTSSSSDTSVASVSVTGNSLNITPSTGTPHGKTTIEVTADDGYGGASGTSFDYTINMIPVFTGSLYVSAPIKYKQVASLYVNSFTDPDAGDTELLTYSAISNLGGTLTVTTSLNSGNTRMAHISGLPRGTNIVTLTAMDPYGGSVSGGTFNVVVNNSAPVYVSNSLPDIVINPDNGLATINLTGSFTDLDDDVITYTSTISSTALASVGVNGNDLTITPVGHGSDTITVVASDGYSGTAQHNFDVIVNRNPSIIVGSSPFSPVSTYSNNVTLTVSNRFTDLDGDTLTYSATTPSSVNLLTVTNLGSGSINISGLQNGTNTVTIKAEDYYGGSVADTIVIMVEPPG